MTELFSPFEAIWIYIASGILSVIVLLISDKASRDFGSQWFPGLVFGLLFGIVHFQNNQLVIAYSITSAIAYFLAVAIAQRLVKSEEGRSLFDFRLDRQSITRAGFVAGAFGALSLALALKLFVDIAITFVDFVTLLIGGIMGVVFLRGLFSAKEGFAHELIRYLSIYIAWQVPVGLSLSYSIVLHPTTIHPGIFAESLKEFLLGPIVQLIGLIASIFGIISFFSRKKG